jgi:hypothetical protein
VTGTSATFSHSVSSTTTYYYRVAAENETYGQTSAWSNTGSTQVVSISTVTYPTEDAYVDASAPNMNFGNDPTLHIKYGNYQTKAETYIKFGDLSQIPANPNYVKLRLKIANGSATAVVYHNTGCVWSESTATWNDIGECWDGNPSYGGSINNGWYEFNVTNILRDWRSLMANFGIVVVATSGEMVFYSSEYPTESYRPHLKLE